MNAVGQQQETSQLKIVACAGSISAGFPEDHLLIVEDQEGNVRDFLTPQEFEDLATKGRLPGKPSIADHDQCPACMAGQLHFTLDKLAEKIPAASPAVDLYKNFLERQITSSIKLNEARKNGPGKLKKESAVL